MIGKNDRSHTVARVGCNLVSLDILPISPQGMPLHEFSYRGNLQQPVEFIIVLTEKKYVPKYQSNLPNGLLTDSTRLS